MSASNQPHFPLNVEGQYSKDGEATASCYCGAVLLAFPTEKPGLVDTFICNCHDCRKITASMFASNFIVDDKYLKHIRGEEKLTRWAQNKTIASGNTMENSFCSVCGSLLYRRSSGYPGMSIMRIGTIDDFNLHETKVKPRVEQLTKDRVSWFHGGEGVEQHEGHFYKGGKE